MEYDYLFKVVFSGDLSVGKSKIILQTASGKFAPDFNRPTIGVEFATRMINIDGKRIKAQLWDIGGGTAEPNFASAYYRGARGIILVYDISNYSSYTGIPRWLKTIRKHTDAGTYILLVGNKSDREEHREVAREEVQVYATENGIDFVETSALDGTGLEAAFRSLMTNIFLLNSDEYILARSRQSFSIVTVDRMDTS